MLKKEAAGWEGPAAENVTTHSPLPTPTTHYPLPTPLLYTRLLLLLMCASRLTLILKSMRNTRNYRATVCSWYHIDNENENKPVWPPLWAVGVDDTYRILSGV
jgi:hypothetical protein